MAAMTVRGFSDGDRVRLGSMLAEIGHWAGGVELEIPHDRAAHDAVDLT